MDYYNEIKKELIKNEVNKKVKTYSINQGDLNTYYNVGKLLSEAGKHYGEGVIKEYSIKLSMELGKNYSTRLLYKTLKYFLFIKSEKVPTLSAKLTWSHYDELLKINDSNKIAYYIDICDKNDLSVLRSIDLYRSKGYDEKWIAKRIQKYSR